MVRGDPVAVVTVCREVRIALTFESTSRRERPGTRDRRGAPSWEEAVTTRDCHRPLSRRRGRVAVTGEGTEGCSREGVDDGAVVMGGLPRLWCGGLAECWPEWGEWVKIVDDGSRQAASGRQVASG